MEAAKINAQVDSLKSSLKTAQDEKDQIEEEFETLQLETNRLQKDMKHKKREAVRSCDGSDPRKLHKENKKLFQAFDKLRVEALAAINRSDTTAPPKILEIREGVEILIRDVERTAMMRVSDDEVLEKYEERVKLIEEYRAELVQVEADFGDKSSTLQSKASQWKTQVRRVCSTINTRFGEYMKKMEAKGEVLLEEHDDFAQWQVVIKVAFRDDNALQRLVRTRQSGGEKTVSTMLYVFSLLSPL